MRYLWCFEAYHSTVTVMAGTISTVAPLRCPHLIVTWTCSHNGRRCVCCDSEQLAQQNGLFVCIDVNDPYYHTLEMICGTKTLVTNDMISGGEARLTFARFSSKLKESFIHLPARHTSLEQNESVLMLKDERPIQSVKQRMTKSYLPSGLDARSAKQSCKPYTTLHYHTVPPAYPS